MGNQWERVFEVVAAILRLARVHGLDDPAELQRAIGMKADRVPPERLPELLAKVERAAPETPWTEDVGVLVIAPQAGDLAVPPATLAWPQSPVKMTSEQRAAIGDRLASVLGSQPAAAGARGQSVAIRLGWPRGGDGLDPGYLLPTVIGTRGVYVFWAADGTAVIPLCQFRMGRRRRSKVHGTRDEQERIGVIGGGHGFLAQLSWACDHLGLATLRVLEGLLEETAVLATREHQMLRPGLSWERGGLVYAIREDRPMSTLVHVTLASEQVSTDGTSPDEDAVQPEPLLIVQLTWDSNARAWMFEQVWPRTREADPRSGEHGAGRARGAARRVVVGTARVAAVLVALADLLLVLYDQREHETRPNLSLVLPGVLLALATVGVWRPQSRQREDHDADGTNGP